MVHFCLDGRGVPHEESDRGDLSEEEVDEEDDVLEDFGGDIGGSRNRDLAICWLAGSPGIFGLAEWSDLSTLQDPVLMI